MLPVLQQLGNAYSFCFDCLLCSQDRNENAVHSTDRIHVDGDSGTIHFRPQLKDDEGDYRCVAFNAVGETETLLHLTVVGLYLRIFNDAHYTYMFFFCSLCSMATSG